MPKILVKRKKGFERAQERDHSNREAYLIAAVELLRPKFAELGHQLPPLRVSVGWPGARGGLKAIGSCWRKEASADGSFQIFVSPILSTAPDALACLIHEICHAVTNCTGHSKEFKRIARAIGLDGKLSVTFPGAELASYIEGDIIAKLGPYPHAALNPGESGQKKQGTRLVKCVCPVTGYTIRTTKTWLDTYGPPISPKTGKAMEVAA